MKSKIRIEIFGKANRKLLEEFLSEKYEISESEFDLLIIDELTLKMKMEEVEKNTFRDFSSSFTRSKGES